MDDQKMVRVSLQKSFENAPSISISALEKSEIIEIEFGDLDYINSSGIRNLTKWFRELESAYPSLSIRLEKVPPIVARALLYIEEVLPKKLQITSLYVPFFCDSCCKEDYSLLVTQAEVQDSFDKVVSAVVLCQTCKSKMTMDVGPEKYLALLRRGKAS
jgi:hypothetical protein